MEHGDDSLVREETEAAAAEAAGIGGRAPDDVDEADRPVQEAGGGVAEGFEQAEEALVEHAEHTSGEGAPRLTQMGEEAEVDPSVHGEPDQLDTTEVVRDPGEPGQSGDDPGAGPGIAADR